MWHDHDGGGWGAGQWIGMSFMLLLALVFVGAIVYLILSFVGGSRDRTLGRPMGRSSADDILAERFARGEIDEDEYARRRNLLHPSG